MTPQLILLWGAPAAGKTAVARTLIAMWRDHTGRPLPHLATDLLSRAIVGPDYLPELRPPIYQAMQVLAEEVTAAGLDVLLDANYLNVEHRRRVEAFAQRSGTPLCRVLIHCSLASRLARNRARVAAERVPEDRVAELHAQAERCREEADVVVDTDVLSVEEGVALILEATVGRRSLL